MPRCELFEDCPFFNAQMADMPATSKIYITTFCERDYKRCARYYLAAVCGMNCVPDDLFPNEMGRARKFESEAK